MRNSEQNDVSKYCLGIESSADDFGVGITNFDGEILPYPIKNSLIDGKRNIEQSFIKLSISI